MHLVILELLSLCQKNTEKSIHYDLSLSSCKAMKSLHGFQMDCQKSFNGALGMFSLAFGNSIRNRAPKRVMSQQQFITVMYCQHYWHYIKQFSNCTREFIL